MHLGFETESLRDLCATDLLSSAELGEAVAQQLQSRLADLLTAHDMSELPIGPSSNIQNGDETVFVIELNASVHLVLSEP